MRPALLEEAGARRTSARYRTVGGLLPAWFEADQLSKPSTLVGSRSVVQFLLIDRSATTARSEALSPVTMLTGSKVMGRDLYGHASREERPPGR